MFVPFQNRNKKYSPERLLMSSFVQKKKKKLKKLNFQTKDMSKKWNKICHILLPSCTFLMKGLLNLPRFIYEIRC